MAEKIKEISINVGEVSKQYKTLTAELSATKKELQQLTIAGDQTSERFLKLQDRAAEVRDAIDNVNNRIKVLSSGTKGIETLTSAARGLAAGFTVAQSATALFGKNSEALEKTLVKVQGSLALLNGVQEITNLLQDDAGVGLFLNIQAQKLYTFAVGETTAALSAFRLALISLSVGAVIAGVVLLVTYWEDILNFISGSNTELQKYNQLLSEEKSNIEFQIKLLEARGASEQDIIDKKILSLQTDNKILENLIKINEEDQELYQRTLLRFSVTRGLYAFLTSRQRDENKNYKEQLILNNAIIEGLNKKNQSIKSSNKDLSKQNELLKEISKFASNVLLNFNINLSKSIIDIQNNFFNKFSETIQKITNEYTDNIDLVRNAIITQTNKTIGEINEKIKELFKEREEIEKLRLENIFNVDEFNKLRSRLNEIDIAIKRLNKTGKELRERTGELDKELTNFDEALNEKILEKYKKELNDLILPLKNLREELKKFTPESGDLDDLNKVIDLSKQIVNNAVTLALRNSELKQLNEEIINTLIKENKTQEERNKLNKDLVDNQNELNKNIDQLNKLNEARVKTEKEITDLANENLNLAKQNQNLQPFLINNQIKYNEEKIKTLELEISALLNTEESAKENKNIIDAIQIQIDLLTKRNNILANTPQTPLGGAGALAGGGLGGENVGEFENLLERINQKSQDFFQRYQEEIQIITTGIQVVGDVVAAQFDFRIAKLNQEIDLMNERYDRELELIQRNSEEDIRRVNNSLLSEEVKQSEIARLQEERANDELVNENRRRKEQEKLERQRNKLGQRSAISQAVIGASLAIIQSFAQLGPIAGAIAAAGIAVTTGLQIATIKRQKFERGGKLQKGGKLEGASHAQGGIPIQIAGGNMVEAEGGEAIINRKSTERFAPLLSAINSYNGWGDKFQRGGIAGGNPQTSEVDILNLDELAYKVGQQINMRPMKAYVVARDVESTLQVDAQIKAKSIV